MAQKKNKSAMMAEVLERISDKQINTCFNPERPDLKSTKTQQMVLEDDKTRTIVVVRGYRSGKSQLGSTALTCWFNNDHPYMERPKEWGDGPLTLMVLGRVGEQIESELYEKKIKPYLKEGTYKAQRTGQSLQRLVHKKNGNRMLFFSHHNISR